jgi:hypothetical protein
VTWLRRARERSRVSLLVVALAALALVGAGFLGAALAGDDEDDTAALEQALEFERARNLELQTQLEATIRRIEEFERQAARAERREREEARSRPSGGSRAASRSQETQP